jgi:hypothetical protein
MPKVLDIIEVKKVIENKFNQLYSTPHDIEIRRANQYISLGIWSVSIRMSMNGKVRYYSINIEIETGNVKEFAELI